MAQPVPGRRRAERYVISVTGQESEPSIYRYLLSEREPLTFISCCISSYPHGGG